MRHLDLARPLFSVILRARTTAETVGRSFIAAQTHISQADYAISAAQADAIKGLINMRVGS